MALQTRAKDPRPPVRQRLLQVADELFYAEGITSVGIDRLIAEADVAKASLYQHFASKDDLVAAYLQERVDKGQRTLDRHMGQVTGTPAERIVGFFALLQTWMTGPRFRGCPFINAAAEFPQTDHPVQRVVAEHRRRTLARFRALAEELGHGDADGLARSLMLVYDGALVAADLGSGAEAGRTAVATVRTLLNLKTDASEPACASPS